MLFLSSDSLITTTSETHANLAEKMLQKNFTAAFALKQFGSWLTVQTKYYDSPTGHCLTLSFLFSKAHAQVSFEFISS